MYDEEKRMNKIAVIGMGPGGGEYLLPQGRKRIEESDFLVGAKRHIRLFQHLGKPHHIIQSSFSEALDSIEEKRKTNKVAVLVSGDPCLFSYLALLRRRFGPGELEVVPGISSFQLLCARFACAYNDAKIISVHGRPLDNVRKALPANDRLVIFTDNENTPQRIARYLLGNIPPAEAPLGKEGQRGKEAQGGEPKRGAGFFDESEWDVYLGVNLSYDDEELRTTTLSKLALEEDVPFQETEAPTQETEESARTIEQETNKLCILMMEKRHE